MHPLIERARTRLLIALAAVVVLVPAALAAAQYPRYWEWIAPELTPMTWVQTVVLMIAAAAAAACAVAGAARGWGRSERLPYWALTFGFTYLAVDDRFAIHERIRDRILAPRNVGIPGLDFLAPGDIQMLLMGVAGLIVLPFVLRALRRDRLACWLFVIGVLAAAGSLAMDSVDPASMPLDVERLSQTLEECVELLAGCCFLGALGVRLLGLLNPEASPEARPGATAALAPEASTRHISGATAVHPAGADPDAALGADVRPTAWPDPAGQAADTGPLPQRGPEAPPTVELDVARR